MQDFIKKSWAKIAPFWPLKNLIAVNPLQGFEDLSIEEALIQAAVYFEQDCLPDEIYDINRETIKWLQLFFDEGQATIYMPMRDAGLYHAFKVVAQFDKNLHKNSIEKKLFIKQLPMSSPDAISSILFYLNIPNQDYEIFLTLMLTTLPGWASHVKYRTEWSDCNTHMSNPVTQEDYLAIRLIITYLLWPQAVQLVEWYKNVRAAAHDKKNLITKIQEFEDEYQNVLITKIIQQSFKFDHKPLAQFVFCIDVRSEPLRRALQTINNYETFGFAGFFGIPIIIKDDITGEEYSSCPVLLTPKHKVVKTDCFATNKEYKKDINGYIYLKSIQDIYWSLKNNFITSFALVEALGLYAGIWTALKTFFPFFAHNIKLYVISSMRPLHNASPIYVVSDISFSEKCKYAQSVLAAIGLTDNFTQFVVLCAHSSSSENNAYATLLDCGACGGRPGGPHAAILASILNDAQVRKYLADNNIIIPISTQFIAAEHNTTTDEVILYGSEKIELLDQIKADLEKAKEINSAWRCKKMGIDAKQQSSKHTLLRSLDWAQVRPEWGLARNASCIVAPSYLTKNIDLDGRAFLHSYDYKKDFDGKILSSILTAPMVVAQWINMQYLFSTLNNVAYGAGSKITKNIVGKFGVMQGNASDLMTGLPLQSVYATDTQPYHKPQRLITLIYAPRYLIDKVILEEKVLMKLFGNGWVRVVCIEPETEQVFRLERDLTWQIVKN